MTNNPTVNVCVCECVSASFNSQKKRGRQGVELTSSSDLFLLSETTGSVWVCGCVLVCVRLHPCGCESVCARASMCVCVLVKSAQKSLLGVRSMLWAWLQGSEYLSSALHL